MLEALDRSNDVVMKKVNCKKMQKTQKESKMTVYLSGIPPQTKTSMAELRSVRGRLPPATNRQRALNPLKPAFEALIG